MRIGFLSATACFGFLCLLPRHAVSQDLAAVFKLEVHVNYTGSGTVDGKHKINVVLWDSPAFVTGGGVMPVDLQASSSNKGTVTFSNITTSTVYISSVYDPKGEWDGQLGPPPDGSSLGLYSKEPNQPERIEIKPGKTTSIELKFDDTVKMVSGKPVRQ